MPNKNLAQLYHFDSFWKRQDKYDNLNNTEFKDVNWKELEIKEPYYFFVPKDFWTQNKYNEGFSVSEIFKINSMWIATWKDNELVSYKKDNLVEKFWEHDITEFYYKPFDIRYTIFDNSILQRARFKFMSNYYNKYNLWFNCVRQSKWKWDEVLASKIISNRDLVTNHTYSFPLYLYNNQEANLLNEEIPEKTPNLNWEIIVKIEEKLWIPFVFSLNWDYSDIKIQHFNPEDIFDYIYAVLHSESYRIKYKEFLKIDFPKIPFDVDKEIFFKMVTLGRELRSHHLLENENLEPKNFITKYEIDGNNLVEKVKYSDKKVFINDTQYFSWVPENVWDFYIWWYQPAQKWLKDRKGRELKYEDIIHYWKIIKILNETIRIMWEIEKIYITK